MHIVSAADDAYVAHFCAMLHSAWLHNPTASYYLLATGVTGRNLDLLREFASRRDIKLEILVLDARRYTGLPVAARFSASTWSRLFIPELLPPAVDRILYLDADISVNARLEPLFHMDMQGRPAAAAPDRQDWLAGEKAALGLDESVVYFNSGVMLLDLGVWRTDRLADRILAFGETMNPAVGLMDQSAFNFVLQGCIQPLDREWNFYDLDQAHATPEPKIIHYSGDVKPWTSKSSPFHSLYRFHRAHTPWPLIDPMPERPPIKPWIKMQRRRLGAGLGFSRYRAWVDERDRIDSALARIAASALDRDRALLAGVRLAV